MKQRLEVCGELYERSKKAAARPRCDFVRHIKSAMEDGHMVLASVTRLMKLRTQHGQELGDCTRNMRKLLDRCSE